ncbi:MAG TPA: D-arabinono-1,4-lactone oxidase [Candidatus Dormibacteraeota bacterium]
MSWQNWGRTYRANPVAIQFPRSEEEIAAIVRDAVAKGQKVKAAGTGHSFTDIACTDGRLLKLDHYNRVLEIDREARTVTVQSGITIIQLNEALHAAGLALENMGDVGYQTISGAISTATHGTGERFRNISSQLRALTIVDGAGQVVRCSADENPDLFSPARVSLGALGVISTVTLQCVPAFYIGSVQQPRRVDELLERFDELCHDNDHFEFFWFPHTDRAQSITNERSEAPLPGRGRSGFGAYVNDVVFENHAFGLVQRIGSLHRGWIPALAGLSGRLLSPREVSDSSHRIFANERRVRFAEMEYEVPREHLVPAFRDVRRMLDRSGLLVSFPVEVRAVAADDIPLSTAYGRPSAYIAVHVYWRYEYEPYFREVEAIMRQYDGRPHWGKLHFRDAASLRPAYPRWDEFQAARARLDPQGVFSNTYLDRVLGPVQAGAGVRP